MRLLTYSIVATSLTLLVSCDPDTIECHCGGNSPPTVWIAAGPAEGSLNPPTVEFFWGGWDSDGDVVRFEYLMTVDEGDVFDPIDTLASWATVFPTDTTFTLLPGSTGSPQHYTFFIRAVDDQATHSESPAHRGFYVDSR